MAMMRASRSSWTCDANNLPTSTPDEFALGFACALLTARDLLSLRLVCRRFNIRCIATGGAEAAAASASASSSGGDAARRGGGGAAVGGGMQRAGAGLGAASRARVCN